MTDQYENYADSDMKELWTGAKVTLYQVLEARETRVLRQQDLLSRYHKPLLCFTMNIAGPIKNNDLIRQGFLIGINELKMQIARVKASVLFENILCENTGNEAYFIIDIDPYLLKTLTCELEDRDDIGRLYDMDVIFTNETGTFSPHKIVRQEIGLPGRRCLICGAPAKECSSRRIHSVGNLQAVTAEILYKNIMSRSSDMLAEYAVRALLYEVAVTPKPGLVDRMNSGSHKDMDFYSFLNSSAALWPYFKSCAVIGQMTAKKAPQETFRALRTAGKTAERNMLRATGGVNTHKGAIFTLGITVAAMGRLSGCGPSLIGTDLALQILSECARMTQGLVASDLFPVTKDSACTVGQQLFVKYGITGVRGEMEAGLPAVAKHGLPLLRKLLRMGKSKDEAGAAVLLNMIAHTADTNLIHRSSVECQKESSETALRIMVGADNMCPERELLEDMDRDYIRRNLSPGGSADLLAVCWFLYTLETEYHSEMGITH